MTNADRAAAKTGISARDRKAISDFAAFLKDPDSRCPICLTDEHTQPSQCPQVTEADRTAATDAAYQRERDRIKNRGFVKRTATPDVSDT